LNLRLILVLIFAHYIPVTKTTTITNDIIPT
jgi:hypothetical protein